MRTNLIKYRSFGKYIYNVVYGEGGNFEGLSNLCIFLNQNSIKKHEPKKHYYKYIRIDMIGNQDKFVSIHVTMVRNIWTQNDSIKQIEVI